MPARCMTRWLRDLVFWGSGFWGCQGFEAEDVCIEWFVACIKGQMYPLHPRPHTAANAHPGFNSLYFRKKYRARSSIINFSAFTQPGLLAFTFHVCSIHTYMHARMRTYIHTYIHTYIQLDIYIYVFIYTHKHMYTYIYIYIYTQRGCVYIYIYIYMCVCVCVSVQEPDAFMYLSRYFRFYIATVFYFPTCKGGLQSISRDTPPLIRHGPIYRHVRHCDMLLL